MGKRIANVTLKRQNNWFKHHRRTLENDDLIYEPFWRIEDIPSWGVKTKVPHFETRHRIVHLLSQNEFWMYLHLVQNPLVIEIYEQYAVPLDLSLAIAEELDVKHPVYPRTKIPTIQTIDFVADVCNPETGEIVKVAYPVKQTSDALRYRTAEKLALQEAYCALEDIDYELITSDQLRTTKSINLECLYRHRNLSPFLETLSLRWLSNFFGILSEYPHKRTAHLIRNASETTGIDYFTGVSIFYNSLWHKVIGMNWSIPLKLEMAASDMGIYRND